MSEFIGFVRSDARLLGRLLADNGCPQSSYLLGVSERHSVRRSTSHPPPPPPDALARSELTSDHDSYVGTLHEINSDESTVSLENVKSFGTEGRKGKAEEEVGPSDQLYEYIVFRSTDVKDLRIEETPSVKENKPPPVPVDPAIVGVSVAHCPISACSMMK